jgi:NADH:ubiquinone oxidoreductase subunit E
MGYKVMIHTNVLAMTFTHPLYRKFKKYQVIDPFQRPQGWGLDIDGDWLTEPYFAYINPGYRQWGDLIENVLGELIRKYKVDGVFLDQTLLAFNESRGPNFLKGMRNNINSLEKAFKKIADETGLKLNNLYGVATFYAQFRLQPVGKHIIRVCHGTACHVQNATAITDDLKDELNVKDGETTEDGIFTLESVACLGCCSLAPVMMIGEETYGKLTGKSAVKTIKDIRRKETAERNASLSSN